MWWVDFTGISAPYDASENPEIYAKMGKVVLKGSVKVITDIEKKCI